jgi:lysophospholipase L1-like esterase
VLTPLPRGPFLELGGFSKGNESVLPTSVIEKANFSLPGHTFQFLEKPEYYFDAFHLNAKGRQKFTETLVSELLGRLQAGSTVWD